ncbi:PQQ-binding-like beta-propeller repeat protein [Hyphobacterium sp.]|uniref:outer membrane protein assembly factor BamB family protein n=1 Tax=Hyphobacterium sp. TaxID=2004662 RepID=UPI003BA9E87B
MTGLKLTRLACLAAILGLAGCSTVSDTAERLNPFDGDGGVDEDAPAIDDRVSILSFEQSLQADPDAAAEPVILPTAYVNSIWSQPDGYPTHAMQHTQASGNLDVVFRRRFGQGSDRSSRINARPIYADGRIYVMDGESRIYALDPDSGREIWEARVRSGNRQDRIGFGGGLAYDNGRLFVHTGRRFMVALDATNGQEIWRTPSLTPFHTAPTAVNNTVFVATDDNELHAIDQNTGEILWNHQGIAEPARLITAPSVAVIGETVVAPYASGEITALRIQNGNPIWNDALTRSGGLTPISAINDVAGSPVIVDDVVYAMSHSGILAAFDLRTGERLWTQPAGGLHAPWVAGDFLFLVTSDGELVCVERSDGTIRWITQLPLYQRARSRRDRIAWAGPVLAGGRLFLASSTGEGLIVDAQTGNIQREVNLRDPVFVAPIIVNETIYVVTDDARLIALR